MIISINPTIFDSTDVDILSGLSKILDLGTTGRHLVDIYSFDSYIFDNEGNYIFNETNFSIDYLSNYQKNQVEDFFNDLMLKTGYLTDIHKKYLSNITVGLDANEFNPTIAYKILTEPSKIIVENIINDWKFVKGIVQKYANHKQRKSIYRLLEKAVDSFWILPDGAGGKGQISQVFENLSTTLYKGIHKLKLVIIFDSDREYNEIKSDQKKLIELFKGKNIILFKEAVFEEKSDIVIWHMLHKREMENYVPLDIILENLELTDAEKKELSEKTPEQYDFIDFDDYFKSNKNINVKNGFPELFLKTSWTREKLEQRCGHHTVKIELPNSILEDVTEIEQILLKIAKII